MEVKLKASRKPGSISIDNLPELEEYIKKFVEPYHKAPRDVSLAKHNKKILQKLKSDLEASLKEAFSVYSAPLDKVKFELLSLNALIDAPLAQLEDYISVHENIDMDKVMKGLRSWFAAHSAILGDYADEVWQSPAFIEAPWLRAEHPTQSTKYSMIAKIERVSSDIAVICASSTSFAPVLLSRYFEDLSLESVEKFKERILRAANGSFPGSITPQGKEQGKATLTIDCTEDEFGKTLCFLKLAEIDYSVDSFSFASYLKEHKNPDFDSFVALDIETTGSFGASSGDSPAEITEIGAVKVKNGKIVDKFSMLANPGRKITPMVARLTHITDDMVRNQPPVNEVVREFIEFVGDNIIVGHGVGANDLPYICRAAQKMGLKLENEYFDTCELAAKLKEKYGWQKIRLEYLSSLFGIKQNNAHRAWCDAEANAEVYFALKRLS